MAGNQNNNDYSENDAFDINELASLNEDISAEFIEQLQNKVSQSASGFNQTTDDSQLFEEVNTSIDTTSIEVKPLDSQAFEEQFDDNFIKKYKAKINKQEQSNASIEEVQEKEKKSDIKEEEKDNTELSPSVTNESLVQDKIATTKNENVKQINNPQEIENLTGGNIVEKPIQEEQLKYNESLDYIDDNVKYSKYVIYIDPENTEFIESLTVKERKNLINRIIREQDDIAITKRRLSKIQAFIKHTIIAIITIAIAIPIVYFVINASLEATVNNYRRSQSNFKILYKEKGKIKKTSNYGY